MTKFESLLAEIQKYTPKAKIAFKDQSHFMSFLAVILFFIPDFKTKYITTIGYTIYFPNQQFLTQNEEQAVEILSHEFVHMWDYKNKNFFFSILYLMPQLLAILSFIAIGAIWSSKLWLLSLIALVFLAPLPAYWRMQSELRGYTMSLAIDYWRYGIGVLSNDFIPLFTSSDYYWMWPFKKDMQQKFAIIKNNITNNQIQLEQPYSIIHDWILNNYGDN